MTVIHHVDIYRREFVKALERVSQRYHVMDVFSDFCAVASCAVEQLTNCVAEREERYKAILEKYTKEEQAEFPKLLALVVDALEHSRESFLGPVLEEIGAANVRNGQFLTPWSVAYMMAECNCAGLVERHKSGELITLNDPACGASVTLISQGEYLLKRGIPQRDIVIYGGDIDYRACDISFIELTILGYAARIDHMNALSMKVLSRPRWTVGYYLHGTQWREGRRAAATEAENETEATEAQAAQETQEQPQTFAAVGRAAQMEFQL